MKFLNIREQKILFEYLKQNMGWFCLENNSFQKNANKGAGCTVFLGNLILFLKIITCRAWSNIRSLTE